MFSLGFVGGIKLNERLFLVSGVQETLEVDTLWSLDRETKGTAPDKLGEWAKSTADTEGDGVVKRLLEAVVVEEDTGSSINIRVRVLGLEHY